MTGREMYARTHPVTILYNLRRVLFLTVIPVARGLVLALQQDFLSWARGAWVDISAVLVMVGIAALYWYSIGFYCDDKAVFLRSGILRRKITVMPWDKAASVSMLETFTARTLGAVNFRADTLGGSRKRADISIYLSKEKARALMASHKEKSGEGTRKYVPQRRSVALMSLLASNSLGGVIFLAAFVSQSGKLLGEEFSAMLLLSFEDFARGLAFGLPPAGAAIAYALLGGWAVGFLRNYAGYKDFTVHSGESSLRIKSGAVSRREYIIRRDKINFIDIRQNITAKLFGLYTLYICAVGYGKGKNDISCIIPSTKAPEFNRALGLLFPGLSPAKLTVVPPRKNIARFIGQPIAACAGIAVSAVLFLRLFPSWDSFIMFTGFMLLVPAGLFLAVRLEAYKTSGIAKKDGVYTVCYCAGINLHTAVIPEDKIISVRFTQSLPQRRKRQFCNVLIHTVSEGKARHLCRNLPLDEVMGLFDE
ncbi:MAG: PH domain-containing protein [Oscillospiraceae bacterium]|nr:PH domain-containing protein [Oscillospiraceae bacterium]